MDSRKLSLVGAILVSLGFVLGGLSQNTVELYITYGVLAAAGWGVLAVISILTTTRWFSRRRGLAMGIVTSGSSAGSIVLPPLVQFLVSGYGWRTALSGIGVLMLPVLLLASYITRTRPDYTEGDPGTKKFSASNSNADGDEKGPDTRFFRILFLALFLSGLGIQTFIVDVVPYLVEAGVQQGVGSYALPALGVGGLLSRWLAGLLSDRIGRMRTLLLLWTILSVSVFLITQLHTLGPLLLDAFIFGLGYGGSIPVSFTAAGDVSSSGSLGTRIALVQAASSVGGVAGPLLTGYLHDLLGDYTFGFWLLSCLLLVSAGIAFAQRHKI